MTSFFRGVEITTLQLSKNAGGACPIQMPADIVAGDWLVISGGSDGLHTFERASSVTLPATGWFAANGARDTFVKIADGSEAGAIIYDFESTNTSGLGGTTRPAVIAAFCYRFPVEPQHDIGITGPYNACLAYTSRNFYDAGTSADSADFGGNYPGGSWGSIEFRFLNVSGSTENAVLDSATWYDNLGSIQDRTGLHSNDNGSFGWYVSWSFADQFHQTAPRPTTTGVVITGSENNVGGFIDGFSLRFDSPFWLTATNELDVLLSSPDPNPSEATSASLLSKWERVNWRT